MTTQAVCILLLFAGTTLASALILLAPPTVYRPMSRQERRALEDWVRRREGPR